MKILASSSDSFRTLASALRFRLGRFAGRFKFHTGNIPRLVQELKAQPGKNIYCDGGSEIANELLKNNLIDEFVISIIPVLLGDGIKLFKDGRPMKELKLVTSRQFGSGLTQLHYIRVNNPSKP